MVAVNVAAAIGYAAATLFGLMAYYAHRVLRNIDEYQDAALVMFFLRDEATRAVKINTLGGALLAMAVTTTAVAFATGRDGLLLISRPLTVVALLGFLYFYRVSALVTAHPGTATDPDG
jgi:hypothetical protein